jgi:hypothetical protein
MPSDNALVVPISFSLLREESVALQRQSARHLLYAVACVVIGLAAIAVSPRLVDILWPEGVSSTERKRQAESLTKQIRGGYETIVGDLILILETAKQPVTDVVAEREYLKNAGPAELANYDLGVRLIPQLTKNPSNIALLSPFHTNLQQFAIKQLDDQKGRLKEALTGPVNDATERYRAAFKVLLVAILFVMMASLFSFFIELYRYAAVLSAIYRTSAESGAILEQVGGLNPTAARKIRDSLEKQAKNLKPPTNPVTSLRSVLGEIGKLLRPAG